MPRRIQNIFTKGRRYTIACIGDSLTHNHTLNVPPHKAWPERLASRLRDLSCSVRARNWGVSGNTTTQMLARVNEMLMHDSPAYGSSYPSLGIIFGGVNDPGAAINAATTQSNLQVMVKFLKNGAKGFVAGQASLPAGASEGDRYIVQSDTSTTGGLTATGATYATVAGTVAGVQAWETRNALAAENGWSRVADLALVPRIMLITPQFLNYTSGADTAASAGSHSGQNATYKAVHDAVVAAGAAESVPVCDLYDYLQRRILNGFDVAASASWHVAGTNQHFNAYGWDLAAKAVLATIQAQSGWIAGLS